MKLKKLLSVLLIMTMVLSVCSAVQADYTYFIPLNDFSSVDNLGFTTKNAIASLANDAGESVLKMNKNTTSSAYFYSSKYNTTGASGIVYEFDIKQLSNSGNPSGFNIYLNENTSKAFLIISSNGGIKYTDTYVYTMNKDSWYNISIKVNYEDKRVYGIIKDASGNIVHSTSFVHTDGNIKSEMAGKADSSILFQTGSSVKGDIFYMDNLSVRALEEGEMDTIPVSITKTIVEENYDDDVISSNPVVFNSNAGGWSYVMYNGKSGWENCLNQKGVVVGGYLGSASIKEATTGSSDKYLEFNLNASSDSSMDYMYYNTLNKANYIQEVTFKVEENVKNMDFRYRVNKERISDIFVGRLDFIEDTVYLGTTSSPINTEFDFIPGTEYTAKVYYAWDAHKGKIEITDGTKSVVLQGDLNCNKNTVDTVEAPYIRFASDTCCDDGRKISIYNYNIYTTDDRSCELKTRYSNFKLSKNVFEEGTITASVNAESNTSFTGYTNNAATLLLAVYENGDLSSLKSVQVTPENKSFSVDNTIGANDTSVKAMLWNMDDGTLTPLFVSKELTKQ